jgi:hypothetical protein
MFADLRWLNGIFAELLSDPRDNTPEPYLVFYTSLSIASTYLLPIIVMLASYLLLKLLSYVNLVSKETTANTISLLYNFFLGGLALAAAACVQGAFLNPMGRTFTINSCFYLLGLVIFAAVLIEACWSTYQDKQNIFKIRVLTKALLLSVIHINALHLFTLVLCFECFFLMLQLKLSQKSHPKLWLFSNIASNISLMMLVYFSRSLLSIFLSIVLIVGAILVEIVIMMKGYKLSKTIN